MQRATTLLGIQNVLDAVPLRPDELEFYVDTNIGRATRRDPSDRMAHDFRNNIGSVRHILFVGYKGSGKSTELVKLQEELKADFLCIPFSVAGSLNPFSMGYVDLLIFLMDAIYEAAERHGIRPGPAFENRLANWRDAEIFLQNWSRRLEIAPAKTFGFDWLRGMLRQLKSRFTYSSDNVRALREEIESSARQLLDFCNEFLTEMRLQLPAQGKKDIILFVEDLDKISTPAANAIFHQNGNALVELRVNTVYTIPVGSYYSPSFSATRPYFSQVYELHMIKVREKNGTPNPVGLAKIREILQKRMDLGLFETPELADQMMLDCGGCLRDVFVMVKEAAMFADLDGKKHIGAADYRLARQEMLKEAKTKLSDNPETGFNLDDYYAVLAKLAKDPEKDLENTGPALDLRHNLAILGYNGEGWCDVHPLVLEILRNRGKL